MGRFTKEKFKSKEGQTFIIFNPTIKKKGSVIVKGKEGTFVKLIKKARKKK